MVSSFSSTTPSSYQYHISCISPPHNISSLFRVARVPRHLSGTRNTHHGLFIKPTSYTYEHLRIVILQVFVRVSSMIISWLNLSREVFRHEPSPCLSMLKQKLLRHRRRLLFDWRLGLWTGLVNWIMLENRNVAKRHIVVILLCFKCFEKLQTLASSYASQIKQASCFRAHWAEVCISFISHKLWNLSVRSDRRLRLDLTFHVLHTG